MKNIYISLLFASISLNCFSQNEANHWYFGQFNGLDFTTGLAVTDASDTAMFSFEGCASVSDPMGNLLFYANSGKMNVGGVHRGVVCNKIHTVMPNGLLGDTCGDGASFQSCIIIPNVGTTNQYYLFTNDP